MAGGTAQQSCDRRQFGGGIRGGGQFLVEQLQPALATAATPPHQHGDHQQHQHDRRADHQVTGAGGHQEGAGGSCTSRSGRLALMPVPRSVTAQAKRRWAHRWTAPARRPGARRAGGAVPAAAQRNAPASAPAPRCDADRGRRAAVRSGTAAPPRAVAVQRIDQQHQAEIVMLGQRAPARRRNADGLLRVGQHQHAGPGRSTRAAWSSALQAQIVRRRLCIPAAERIEHAQHAAWPACGAIGASRSLPRSITRSPRRCADHAATAPARAACTDETRGYRSTAQARCRPRSG